LSKNRKPTQDRNTVYGLDSCFFFSEVQLLTEPGLVKVEKPAHQIFFKLAGFYENFWIC